MHQDLLVIINWFKANQLSINLGKPVLMNDWPSTNKLNIKKGDIEIPSVMNHKFPGVFVDEELSWNYHTEHLYNKLMTNKHLLHSSKNILHQESMFKVYYGHINSH